jgi:hypothetical protein
MNNDNSSLILAGEKEELIDLGNKMKALLPGGDKLSDVQAMSVGNYAELTRSNPFRGEIYGYESKGQLVLVDGYKLLIRWAKKISDYDEDYGDRLPPGVEGLNEADIGYRCTIMRHDRKGAIREYVDMGATFKEAYDLVSNSAVGVVTANETRNAPPKGWSWDQVARKRALKNVLNQAYAMPSIEELARETWMVDDVETKFEDWAAPEVYKTTEEAEAHARMAAQERERQEEVAEMTEEQKSIRAKEIRTATITMRRNGDDDPIEDVDKPLPSSMLASSKFWTYAYSNGLDRAFAGQFIQQANGDFDEAIKKMKEAAPFPRSDE